MSHFQKTEGLRPHSLHWITASKATLQKKKGADGENKPSAAQKQRFAISGDQQVKTKGHDENLI